MWNQIRCQTNEIHINRKVKLTAQLAIQYSNSIDMSRNTNSLSNWFFCIWLHQMHIKVRWGISTNGYFKCGLCMCVQPLHARAGGHPLHISPRCSRMGPRRGPGPAQSRSWTSPGRRPPYCAVLRKRRRESEWAVDVCTLLLWLHTTSVIGETLQSPRSLQLCICNEWNAGTSMCRCNLWCKQKMDTHTIYTLQSQFSNSIPLKRLRLSVREIRKREILIVSYS